MPIERKSGLLGKSFPPKISHPFQKISKSFKCGPFGKRLNKQMHTISEGGDPPSRSALLATPALGLALPGGPSNTSAIRAGRPHLDFSNSGLFLLPAPPGTIPGGARNRSMPREPGTEKDRVRLAKCQSKRKRAAP